MVVVPSYSRCDGSFKLQAKLRRTHRVAFFRTRRFLNRKKDSSPLIARRTKERRKQSLPECGCRRGIATHSLVRPTACTKHLCSNINTGNREDSQTLLGFVTPVAEFTRLPGGYPYTVFADTSPRVRATYAAHAHAFQPASCVTLREAIRYLTPRW